MKMTSHISEALRIKWQSLSHSLLYPISFCCPSTQRWSRWTRSVLFLLLFLFTLSGCASYVQVIDNPGPSPEEGIAQFVLYDPLHILKSPHLVYDLPGNNHEEKCFPYGVCGVSTIQLAFPIGNHTVHFISGKRSTSIMVNIRKGHKTRVDIDSTNVNDLVTHYYYKIEFKVHPNTPYVKVVNPGRPSETGIAEFVLNDPKGILICSSIGYNLQGNKWATCKMPMAGKCQVTLPLGSHTIDLFASYHHKKIPLIVKAGQKTIVDIDLYNVRQNERGFYHYHFDVETKVHSNTPISIQPKPVTK